ncbi:ParB/Srx family N-terminal domain-containing protein [Shewanella indica]|uniref:ParB/Srx family N-terminal domain-containing protein n=1 Tax=Shewanella indica TaxID=768528 RepID=A0ABU4Q853_9GAMM|nr:ParB/Srx family N-terminal domain-containing protein [Shewanella indica]MDX6015607.1 ParB/Srx family N-terminal domain-containing protein [Shewanella indica]
MATEKKQWWENRVLRSVDNLKLWDENPRLDPASSYIKVRDFVDELIADPTEQSNFLDLVKSIATRGFLSFDPIVVWKNKEDQFVVAEGNRRVMALKLLRSPNLAPNSIRKTIVEASRQIDRDEIEKIRVCLAPSYEEARWYILQRHSTASHQVKWQRLPQQRFIISVYDSVGQNLEKTIELTGFKRAQIVEALRFVKVRDLATREEVTKHLNQTEKELVYSHRISMTVLERWFNNSKVRSGWFISFNDQGISIDAEMKSFYYAYAKFLKCMLSKNEELGFIINTRTIDSKFDEIYNFLPKVVKIGDIESDNDENSNQETSSNTEANSNEPTTDTNQNPKNGTANPKSRLKGDPKRPKLTDNFHTISSRNFRINELFREFKKLPTRSYPNVTAAALRVFLDLAVDDFIKVNDLEKNIADKYKKSYRELTLKNKLTSLKNEYIDSKDANKVIGELLQENNQFSLNTLNEFIHGHKNYKIEPSFLNRFWDMLSPLFEVLIDLKEI